MKRKIIYANALVFAIVLYFFLIVNSTATNAKKQERDQQWEYKIYKATDTDIATNKTEEEFNKLAMEGWEFVETIVSGERAGTGKFDPKFFGPLHATTCVLFKRIKN